MNCMLLTFAPFVIVYRGTKLSEENALYSCVMAGLGFAATQILKIFVMATFLPSFVYDGAHFSLAQEILKSLTLLVDWFGIYYTIQLTPRLSKFETSARILCVGIGWSAGEAIASYLIPLWIGARGMEFSWQYIEMGISANINLWLHTAFIGLVWLRSRTNLDPNVQPVVLASCATYILLPSILNYLSLVLGVPTAGVIFVRAAVTVALCVECYLIVSRYGAGAYRSDDTTGATATPSASSSSAAGSLTSPRTPAAAADAHDDKPKKII